MALKKPKKPKAKMKLPLPLHDEVYEALKRIAEEENRSMTGQALHWIKLAIDNHKPSGKE